ncbi:Probable transmembrane protein [Candidatus Paraburkholderia kirkii UZHbot1]|uniref:Probable transmembrane protein n=1 Tax=Candidatus Paraburkholderia kirkii UZHbot1 TaxID=1055526 RepID=G4MCC9_9BURK|nr:Probable transmembrane protein [Candidatus Paraburkholderia kirkii UZHbot1]
MNRPYEPYPPPVTQDLADPERLRSMRTFTHVLYALYAVYWLTGGLTGLVAIILDCIKRGDAAGTLYENHFTWQIRTFWWAVLGHLIGFATIWIGVGFLILAAVSIWTLYRIIKGWLFLYENKTIEPRAWF